MKPKLLSAVICMTMAITSRPSLAAGDPELKRENFQKEIDGKKVDLYSIRNKKGMVVKITNWGAKVIQVLVPDNKGYLGDVALGYDSIDTLQGGQASMGAFVGRYANRIGGARFTPHGPEDHPAADKRPPTLPGGD